MWHGISYISTSKRQKINNEGILDLGLTKVIRQRKKIQLKKYMNIKQKNIKQKTCFQENEAIDSRSKTLKAFW